MKTKDYLGDSVYVEWEPGRGLILTTNNGMGPTNTIYLDSDVYAALLRFVERMKEKAAAE